MNPGIKRTQRDYTPAFKLSVVEQLERQGELAQCDVDGHPRPAQGASAPQ